VIELLLQADRLLNVDMVDQAERIYRRVVEQDPQNAIAVVGLARCALARGDDREGYRLTSQALTIDPDNDMARRLEARLAETLAALGEPLVRPAAAAGPMPGIDIAMAGGSQAASDGGDRSGSRPSNGMPTPTSRHRSWIDRLTRR
jgi:thioredoxin-like negative regulator of GroEL